MPRAMGLTKRKQRMMAVIRFKMCIRDRNNAKDYIESGDATLKDVISVRDDIMTYLIQTGIEPQQSFKISESVRKGKGLKPEWEDLMREHGIADWYIESCKKIQYMFPRAHAAAYVMMAYRIAWFKVHQPMAFYSAYFGIRASGFDASIMCLSLIHIWDQPFRENPTIQEILEIDRAVRAQCLGSHTALPR